MLELHFETTCAKLEALEEQAKKGLDEGKKVTRYWILSRESAVILQTLARARKPQVILELGGSIGYSTIWLAEVAQENKGHVYTIEKDWKKIEIAKQSYEDAVLSKFVTLYEGQIEEFITDWKGEKIDFLFIDAAKKDYLKYLKCLEPHLSPRAVVVADNVTNRAELVTDYKNYVENSELYKTMPIATDNGFLVSVRV